MLSAVFSHAKVAPNPVKGSTSHKDPSELRAVLEASREHGTAGALIRFLALTACRKGEALAMRWRDVDLYGASWCKPASTTKGGRDHTVPLALEAVGLLREIGPGEPSARVFGCSASSLQRAFRECCAAAGVENARVHDLRRSAATLLATSGAPLPVVGRLLGHRPGSAITSRIYARSTSEAEVEAVASLARLCHD